MKKRTSIILLSLFLLAGCHKQGALQRTSGMMPNIKVGEIVPMEKPQVEYTYGDIVVYSNDKLREVMRYDQISMAQRIVGLPGDSVETRNALFFLNGEPCDGKLLRSFRYEQEELDMEEFLEILPNGVELKIWKTVISMDFLTDNFPKTCVPQGCYFVMGDNRSCSVDSRIVGVISHKDILGVVKQ